jgi:Holliday junction resolvase
VSRNRRGLHRSIAMRQMQRARVLATGQTIVPYNRHRRDTAQAPMIRELRQRGYSVLDISQVGGNAPDLVVSKNGFTFMIEVKTGKSKARQGQQDFAQEWRGLIIIASKAEEVVEIVKKFAPKL